MNAERQGKTKNNDHDKKLSPREENVLRRYGVINKAGNDKRARTINELYKQRYKAKNR